MSTLTRKIVIMFIGLLAGIASWPAAEMVLWLQSQFISYLIFSLVLGTFFGIFFGAFFGSIEGITLSNKSKIMKGIYTGAAVGMIGGAVGSIAGQAGLFFTGEMLFHSNKSFQAWGIPISRTVGWMVMGMFIGSIEGIRAMSWSKIKVGILGGLIGGLLGGALLEYLRNNYPLLSLARLLGLSIMGLLIGFFYGLIENRFSQGVLKILNGKLKNKEFLLIKRKIKIGSSKKADIQLTDYNQIEDDHALITLKGEIITLSSQNNYPVFVNEDKIKSHNLKFEDVLKIGSAKFLFYYK